jgi:hypothetical protein
MIERSGTGIGKSGTGIEKSGTGIEKSGTGIEKDGTGIEKSGTGIRRFFVTCTLAGLLCTGSVNAGSVDPAGTLQVVVQDNTVAVSWIIGESVFSGVSRLSGTYASLMLTEVALAAPVFDYEGTVNGTGSNTKVTGNGTGSSTKVTGNGTGNSTEVTGNGTGSSTDVTGNGTGSSTDVTGNGTGSSTDVTGNGTGSSTDVTGNGTGSSTDVTGNGTGSSTDVTGNGTGSSTDVTGNGTGSSIQVTGNGTGGEAITITFPQGTGMIMEVSVGCGSALVTVLDQSFVPIVEFTDVAVYGDARFCDADVDEPGRGENKSKF